IEVLGSGCCCEPSVELLQDVRSRCAIADCENSVERLEGLHVSTSGCCDDGVLERARSARFPPNVAIGQQEGTRPAPVGPPPRIIESETSVACRGQALGKTVDEILPKSLFRYESGTGSDHGLDVRCEPFGEPGLPRIGRRESDVNELVA